MMLSGSRSFCTPFSPVQCFGLRGLERFKSGLVASSAMIQSTYVTTGQVDISAAAVAASPAPWHERFRREASTFRRDWSKFTSATARGVKLEAANAELFSRGFRVLGSCRCHSVQKETSAVSFIGVTPSRVSLISAQALAGQNVAEPSLEPAHDENEYGIRESVLKYVQSQKIQTAELESVALPASVAVMEERVMFLKKIGLTTEDINDYPLMLGCSVKKNLIPVLSYLEKLNVDASSLPGLIRKYPMVLNSSVEMDLEPVVTFLVGIGIDRLNVGKVLTRYPDILGFKIEGTMSTSVAYLVSVGVNMRDIGWMITEYPEILGMRVGNNIKLKVEYLLGLGIPKEVLAKVLEVKPFILGFDVEEKMKPAIKDLMTLGVREDRVAGVVIQYADVLGLNIRHRMESKMGWLVKHAGVKREDIARVIEKLPQILAINVALAQCRATFLTREGFAVEDLGIMVTKCPQILALSIEEVLKPHLFFFKNSMKRPLSELVNFPFYFTYSLERRIRPRYVQIEQKCIQCSLSWFLDCSDAKFADRLLLDFVQKPNEEQLDPLVSMGGRLRIKGEDPVQIRGEDERNKVMDEENKWAAAS